MSEATKAQLGLAMALSSLVGKVDDKPPEPKVTMQDHASRLQERLYPSAPEPVAESEPVIEAEPQDTQFIQTQQQLANFQYQLIQEQNALKAEETRIRALRRDDPAEYAASMADLQEKQAQFAVRAGAWKEAAQKFDSEYSKKFAKAAESRRNNDMQYMKSQGIPWSEEVGKQLITYLRKEGVPDDTIQHMDARTIALHYKRMTSQTRKTIPASAQRKPAPVDPHQQAEANIRSRRLKPGSIDAAQERIMARMSRGRRA